MVRVLQFVEFLLKILFAFSTYQVCYTGYAMHPRKEGFPGSYSTLHQAKHYSSAHAHEKAKLLPFAIMHNSTHILIHMIRNVLPPIDPGKQPKQMLIICPGTFKGRVKEIYELNNDTALLTPHQTSWNSWSQTGVREITCAGRPSRCCRLRVPSPEAT